MIDLTKIVDDESADAALREWLDSGDGEDSRDVTTDVSGQGHVIQLSVTRDFMGVHPNYVVAVRAALRAAGEEK